MMGISHFREQGEVDFIVQKASSHLVRHHQCCLGEDEMRRLFIDAMLACWLPCHCDHPSERCPVRKPLSKLDGDQKYTSLSHLSWRVFKTSSPS